MKIKKLQKLFSPYEEVAIWGNDEDIPVFRGLIENIPIRLDGYKLIEGPNGYKIDIRYGCSDCTDHIAVFIEE